MNKLIKKAFTVGVVVTTVFWAMGFVAFVPVAQTATSGSLIKGSLPAVYYYGADGKRYVFPNEKTYKTWYSDFSGVTTISDSELASYPIGGNVTYKPGVKMIKITTDPKVYAIASNGTLRWVTSEAIASSLYGTNWSQYIEDVPDAFFVNYTPGADINAASDYNKTTETNNASSIGADKGLSGGAGGDLTITVKSKPAAASVPRSATVTMIEYNFCAGSKAVNLSKVNLTQTGLGATADISAAKTVWDGIQKGGNKTADANKQYKFNYTTNVNIPANTCKTMSVKADVYSSASTGNELVLGLVSASDIVGDFSAINGGTTFPMYSNAMTVNGNITIGALYVDEGGDNPTSDLKLNVGDTDKTITQIKLRAGSAENVLVNQVYFIKGGSAGNDDVKNLDLYNDTDGKLVGTLGTWDADGHAVYNFDPALTINKGESKTLTFRVDVEGGTSRTVTALSIDGSTWNMTASGATYGYGITAQNGTWSSTTGTATEQTVLSGTVNIVKSTSTPATGNIAPGASSLPLFRFDAVVKGEPVSVSRVEMTGIVDGTIFTYDELTNCGLYDPSGVLVAGPANLADQSSDFITWTDTFIMPIGTTTYTAKCNIASTVTTGGTVYVGFDQDNTDDDLTGDQNDPYHALTVKGTISGNTIYPTPADTDVTGNTMTVAGGALQVTNMTTPPAQGIVRGSSNVNFAKLQLDATSSGEDVKVSKLTITLNIDGAENENKATDLSNAYLKVDGAMVGDYVQFDQTTAATDDDAVFNLTTPIIVPAGGYKTVDFYASINAGADATASRTETGTFNYILAMAEDTAADLTAVGATTGTAITETVTGTGQKFDLLTQGTLTTVAANADPDAKIVVSGSKGVTWNVISATADNEDVRVDTLHLTLAENADGDVFNANNFDKFYLYVGSTKLSEAPTSATPEFTKINYVVPKGQTVDFIIKTDVACVGMESCAGIGDASGSIDLNATGDLEAVGVSSGQTVNASAAVTTDLSNHWILRSVPTFAKVSDGSTALTAGLMETLRFTITADANSDVAFGYETSTRIPTDVFANMEASGEDNSTTSGYLYDVGNGKVVSELYTDWLEYSDNGGGDGVNEYPVFWDFNDGTDSYDSQNSTTISAGTTRTYRFVIDLTGAEDTGDYFRMEINDSTASDLMYWDNNNWSGGTSGEATAVSGTPTTLIPGLPIVGNTYTTA